VHRPTLDYIRNLQSIESLKSICDALQIDCPILFWPPAKIKGQSDTYLDKAVSNIRQVIPPGLAKELAQGDRLRSWLVACFAKAGSTHFETSRAGKIAGCQRSQMVFIGSTDVKVIPYSCNLRVCPTCAKDRSADRFARAYQMIQKRTDPDIRSTNFRWITLTSKNVPFGNLDTAIRAQVKAFRQLRREKSSGWQDKVKGYIWNWETTINCRTKTWHPHIHIVYEGEFWIQKDLSMSWARFASRRGLTVSETAGAHVGACYVAGPDGQKAKPQNSRDIRASLLETTKYTLKPLQSKTTPAKQVCEIVSALHNKRLCGSGGSLAIPGTDRSSGSDYTFAGGLGYLLEDKDSPFFEDPEIWADFLKAVYSRPKTLPELVRTYPRLALIVQAGADDK